MTQWGLDTLFNPAKRHMDEEKRRLQSTREEIGDSSGGKRIEFESGKVTIRRTEAAAPHDEAERGPDGARADATEIDKAEIDKEEIDKKEIDKKQPSAAAIRAAKRRGRQPR